MNIVDSSAWLEYFGGTKRAQYFRKIIKNLNELLIPSIVLYEVFKKIHQQNGRKEGIKAIAQMKQGKVVDLDMKMSLLAATLSLQYKLPMADSIILATSQTYKAVIWTQDSDFKKIPNVKYFRKK